MTMVPLHTLAAGAYFVAMDLEVAGVVDRVGPGWVDIVIQRPGSEVVEHAVWSRTTEVEEVSRKHAVRAEVAITRWRRRNQWGRAIWNWRMSWGILERSRGMS